MRDVMIELNWREGPRLGCGGKGWGRGNGRKKERRKKKGGGKRGKRGEGRESEEFGLMWKVNKS